MAGSDEGDARGAGEEPADTDAKSDGSDDEAGHDDSEASGDAEAGDAQVAPPSPTTAAAESGRRFSWWWLLPAAMVVEFWVYGHNGYIDVCVGKDGHTDFELAGQPRTDENRWKFPRCESRTNLGLRSNHDARVEEATKVACRGATLFRFQGEAGKCEAGEAGWQHRVDTRFCPPWDPNYYEHLFWFLK